MEHSGGMFLGEDLLAYLVLAITRPQQDPVMGFFRTDVHSGLMLAAALGGVVVARRSAPAERAAWWALAGGLVAYAGGEIVWRFVYAEQAAPPYPSLADALWLTTYPLFYVGVMLLIRARVAAFQSGAWLDGLIACTAVAAVADPLPLGAVALGLGAAHAAAAVPHTPGGVGVVEIAMTAALAAAGLDTAVALGAVLAYRLVGFWLPVTVGAGLLGSDWLRRAAAT